jgi:hypothetical protein
VFVVIRGVGLPHRTLDADAAGAIGVPAKRAPASGTNDRRVDTCGGPDLAILHRRGAREYGPHTTGCLPAIHDRSI